MQQLLAIFEHHQNLHRSANDLTDSYMRGAETLLLFEASTPTLDGLECWPLLAKLYVNAGKPRKAWLSSRRALDFALILGLHRATDQADEHRRWASIWQAERHAALITGVPCGIAESYTSLSKEYYNQSIVEQVLHRLSVVCGRITERNQDPQHPTHTASKIEEELQQCRDMMPSEWWDYESSHFSFHMLYVILGIKLRYLELLKYLHLPYMLTPCTFGYHQRSKAAVLNAAREGIRSYQYFRRACGSSFILCDLLDFAVFTGGVSSSSVCLVSHRPSNLIKM
jgi:hypothetical protein